MRGKNDYVDWMKEPGALSKTNKEEVTVSQGKHILNEFHMNLSPQFNLESSHVVFKPTES